MPQPTFLTHMYLDTEISSKPVTEPNVTLIEVQQDSEDSPLPKAGLILATIMNNATFHKA